MADDFHHKNVGTVAGVIGAIIFIVGMVGVSLYLS